MPKWAWQWSKWVTLRHSWKRASLDEIEGILLGDATAIANHTDDGVDLNGVAFRDVDSLKRLRQRYGDFGVGLVSWKSKTRFVAPNLVKRAKNCNFEVSDSNEGENKRDCAFEAGLARQVPSQACRP
jgi:hypothetical protein